MESPVTWYPSQSAWGMLTQLQRPQPVRLLASRRRGVPVLSRRAIRGGGAKPPPHEHPGGGDRLRAVRPRLFACHGHTGRPADDRPRPSITPSSTRPTCRASSEAVCQQCHLKSVATIPNPHRELSDFRPGSAGGLPPVRRRNGGPVDDGGRPRRADAREPLLPGVGYAFLPDLPRPARRPAARDRTASYDSIYLKCHKPESCTVEPHRRERENLANDCVQCHMPHSPTDIPHLAFTHHRIGIYDNPPPVPSLPCPRGWGTAGEHMGRPRSAVPESSRR